MIIHVQHKREKKKYNVGGVSSQAKESGKVGDQTFYSGVLLVMKWVLGDE